jgi:hypothetical protein
VPRSARGGPGPPGAPGGGWRGRLALLAGRSNRGRPEESVSS